MTGNAVPLKPTESAARCPRIRDRPGRISMECKTFSNISADEAAAVYGNLLQWTAFSNSVSWTDEHDPVVDRG